MADRALSELLGQSWTQADPAPPSAALPSAVDVVDHGGSPRRGWSRARRGSRTVNVSGRVPGLAKRDYEYPGDGSELAGLVHSTTTVPSFDNDIYRILSILRRRSRQEYERNPYVKKTVRLWKQNVVGPNGMKLRSVPRMENGDIDRDLSKLVEDGWKSFGKFGVPDVTGRLSMRDIENLVVFELLVDGEFFCLEHRLGPWGFQVELIDPQRVDPLYVKHRRDGEGGREVLMGVEVDRRRRPRAYWISDDEAIDTVGILNAMKRQKRRRIRRLARSVCHVMEPEFSQQLRGVPGLATTLSRFENIRGYEDSEMLAARIAASKLGFLSKSETGVEQLGDDVDEEGNPIIEAAPGTITQLEAGVEFTGWDPTHPSSNFPSFLKTQLQAAATGAGVGYHDTSGDMASVNFSSLRQQNITQRDQWRMGHMIVSSQFSEWVFGKWILAALEHPEMLGVKLGDLSPRQIEQIGNAEWVPRSYEHVQPREQANAETTQLGNRTRSVSSFIRERGDDPEEVFAEIANERERMKALGILDAMDGDDMPMGGQ